MDAHEEVYAVKALCLGVSVAILALGASAQTAKRTAARDKLQRDYQAAQNFQAARNLDAAAGEYRVFLGEALHRLALGRANIGDLQKALPLFAEALSLVPSDVDTRVDYAEACRRAGDLPTAKSLAQEALQAEPQNARAHLTLGRVLSELQQHPAAIEQFETAVALQPDFESTYALGTEYLRAKNEPKAAEVFAGILKATNGSPAVEISIGTAYAQQGYPNQAIAAFKKVIASHPKYPGAHYSLGAAYLVGASDAMYPQAAEQFRAELALNPNDPLSRYQLGYIELSQHKLTEAAADLTRATMLDPTSPDAFLALGQVYMETSRGAEAEAALRKSIALTRDPRRNHYQVQRAHYMLARLLLQAGHEAEGKAEMQISEELLRQSVLQNQGRSANAGAGAPAKAAGSSPAAAPPVPSTPVNAAQEKEVAAFEKQIAPAIADSFNNLGAIAAGKNQLSDALAYFEGAYAWNPSLPGLDYNWGRAAFAAGQFDEAAGPLGRYVAAHPQDAWARSALGASDFMLRDYAGVVAAVQPIKAQLGPNVQLAYMYGVSLIRTGQYESGVAVLKSLEAKQPRFAPAREALGEAFASRKDYADAAGEFREVIKLSPADFGAQYNLALALIELRQNSEAQALLAGLQKNWPDPHVYYTLGKLQLEAGDLTGAISNLEKAAALSPNSGPIHHELADAYRRAARTQDADREMKLYQELESAAAKAPARGPGKT